MVWVVYIDIKCQRPRGGHVVTARAGRIIRCRVVYGADRVKLAGSGDDETKDRRPLSPSFSAISLILRSLKIPLLRSTAPLSQVAVRSRPRQTDAPRRAGPGY